MNTRVLETKRTFLKPLSPIEESLIVKWRNDPQIGQMLFSVQNITLESHRKWFEKYQTSDKRMEWVIYLKDSNKAIGTIGLSEINWDDFTAEYGILIGEKDFWGQGFANEVSHEILRYAILELNLKKVFLNVYKKNSVALKLYATLGFKAINDTAEIIKMEYSKETKNEM